MTRMQNLPSARGVVGSAFAIAVFALVAAGCSGGSSGGGGGIAPSASGGGGGGGGGTTPAAITNIAVSPNPVTEGQSVTLTATVNGTGSTTWSQVNPTTPTFGALPNGHQITVTAPQVTQATSFTFEAAFTNGTSTAKRQVSFTVNPQSSGGGGGGGTTPSSPTNVKLELTDGEKIYSKTPGQEIWVSAGNWQGLTESQIKLKDGQVGYFHKNGNKLRLILPEFATAGTKNLEFTFDNGASPVQVPITVVDQATENFRVLVNYQTATNPGEEVSTTVVNGTMAAVTAQTVGNGDRNVMTCPGEDSNHVWSLQNPTGNKVIAIYHNLATNTDVANIEIAASGHRPSSIAPLRGGKKAVVVYDDLNFFKVVVVDSFTKTKGTPLVLNEAGKECRSYGGPPAVRTVYFKESAGAEQDYALFAGHFPDGAGGSMDSMAVIRLQDMTYVREDSPDMTVDHILVTSDFKDHGLRVTLVGNDETKIRYQSTIWSPDSSAPRYVVGSVGVITSPKAPLVAARVNSDGHLLIAFTAKGSQSYRILNTSTKTFISQDFSNELGAGVEVEVLAATPHGWIVGGSNATDASLHIFKDSDLDFTGAGKINNIVKVALSGAEDLNSVGVTPLHAIVEACHGGNDNRLHLVELTTVTPVVQTQNCPGGATAPTGQRGDAAMQTSLQQWRDLND